ncbi:MAG TPA: alpha/beta hydrolase [Bryobacteraceae bacterium]|nr:alpha/beta hydrolase [Bryobacteraceae bacterium]
MTALNPRRTLYFLLLVAALSLSACSRLKETSAIDRLHPCKSAEGLTDAYCGTFDVWEDRQAKSGRKIALKIAILPALKQKYAPDPLFFLAGGPGQGAAELARDVRQQYRPIETDRDIVFVDQRGTGKSNPLDCKPGKNEEDEDGADASAAMAKRLHACLDSYMDKADVTKYTTEIAMDDLDDVRQFLGYSKVDLYGGSYGTRAAIVYARRHADHTRAVILDGVAPTDMRLPLYMARDSQRALDLLLQDCEKDPGCNHRFPNLRDRLKALLARLSAHPQHVRYVHPRTGLEKDLDVKRLTVTGILFASLYSPMTGALVPLLIEQAEKGNYTGFLALGSAYDPVSENMALGMQFSVLCSEDAPRIEPGSVERETAGTFLGAEMAELRLKPCDFWPRGQVEPDYYANSPSDTPALILSGELDPVTPPSWGQLVASQWKNSRHIVVPASGHGAWSSGCVMKLMAQFLNNGSAANLDAGCVSKGKRPPFFLGPSGPDPMGGAAK